MKVELQEFHDGDTPSYTFVVKDDVAIRDGATFAVEWKIETEDGDVVATRPGVLLGPKSSGQVRIYLKGMESDWGGDGRKLIVKPKVYYATALDGTPAVNLLVNPSFDTASGTSPTRIASSWLQSASGGTFDNFENDPAPPSIFGPFQSVKDPTSNFLYQEVVPSPTPVAGEKWSLGVWSRGHGISGIQDDFNSIILEGVGGVAESLVVRLPVGSYDWRFFSGTMTVANLGHTIMKMSLAALSTHTGEWRFDDAFLFKGFWRVFHADPMELPVTGRSRVPKSSNQIAGVGGFECDSDSDGVADGFAKIGGSNTYSIEKSAPNVFSGRASQKVVLGDASSAALWLKKRGHYIPGETWRADIQIKTSGALGSGSGTGGFNITLRSEYFDLVVPITASTNLGTNHSSFTQHFVDLVITQHFSVLVVEINLNGKTGTMWLDDLRLYRTVAAP